MGMIQEFKKFAIKGNVVDLAVGIIIGGAFSTIVKSLVDDILMPPIGYLTGGVDFSDKFIDPTGGQYASLDAAREAGAPAIAWGLFVNNVITFLIVAFAVFLLVKGMNRIQERAESEKPEDAPVAPPKDIQLLEEIRDAIRTRGV